MTGFASMLFICALAACIIVTGAPVAARAYARFAFGLYAALAPAAMIDLPLANSVALIACSISPLLLAFALAHTIGKPVAPAAASAILAVSWLAGMTAAATGLPVFAIVPLLLSVLATIALALMSWRERKLAGVQAIISACALLAGASTFVAGGVAGFAGLCAFTSAGLLGAALSIAQRSNFVVENKRGRDLHGMPTIGGLR